MLKFINDKLASMTVFAPYPINLIALKIQVKFIPYHIRMGKPFTEN